MTSKKKEALLAEQQAEEERKRSGEKAPEPTAVELAQEELEIAKAKVQAEAIRAGYPMPDPIEAWHVDIEQQKKRIADETQKNLEDAAKNKAAAEKLKTDADALARSIDDNNKRQKELEDGLKEIAAGKRKIVEVYENSEKEAIQDLQNFRQVVGGKTIGNIEAAMQLLSLVKSSLVKRVSLSYSCSDCHKENAKAPERQAVWEIPTLDFLTRVKNASYDSERDEWKLGDGFGLCADCEQTEGRICPESICDICPVQGLVIQAIDKIAMGLTLAGVKVQWDADGIYKAHFSAPKKGDVPPKEWVRSVLIDTNLSDEAIEQKTAAALEKLSEEPPLIEPEGLEESGDGEDDGDEPVVVQPQKAKSVPPVSGEVKITPEEIIELGKESGDKKIGE